MKHIIIRVDLAEKYIQACMYANKKVHPNQEMTPNQFSEHLVKLSLSLVEFDSCTNSNYWNQLATELMHKSRLISLRFAKIEKRMRMKLWSPFKPFNCLISNLYQV